jgi:diaminopimelate decarboxylase
MAFDGVAAWRSRVARALEAVDTPFYLSAWAPVADAVQLIETLRADVPVRPWLSFKTHPLPALAKEWLQSGRGVEVVSEREFATVLALGASPDRVLVNGVAKHTWLSKYPQPRLRVHFDSLRELDALLPLALAHQWRVGVRCHVPSECDARDPSFGGQFGMSRSEAVGALQRLQDTGADLQSVHFHLGQRGHSPHAYRRAVDHVASICIEANVHPQILDCGGGLPSRRHPRYAEARDDLAAAVRGTAAQFRDLHEIWLEQGRAVTETSTVLAVRVQDIKERDECRYVICDGGRTNQALAADHGPHPIFVEPDRDGTTVLTTVCGPTCMTDDRLGRWELPRSIAVGDILVWLDAGAYHLPWETRFSQGLCAIVWCDRAETMHVVRPAEIATEGLGIEDELSYER